MFNTIKEKLSWKAVEKDLSEVVQRFPLVVVALFVLFGTSTILIHVGFNEQDIQYSLLVKTMVTSIYAALFAYSMRLGFESWDITEKYKIIALYVLYAVTIVLYFMYVPGVNDTVPSQTIFTLMAINGLLLITVFTSAFEKPFFKKTYRDTPFYSYVLTQLFVIIQAGVVVLAIGALGSATLGSISALFGLSINGEWYGQIFILAGTLVAPLYVLANTPKEVSQGQLKIENIQKFLRFLILYIALPFIFIYIVILYAYTGKVLLNFSQWPEGIVSWLVIFFSFFGWLIYFLSYHFKGEPVVATFRKWFPYVMVPQIAMLFYAIGLRISQHGVTINRYLVVAFGLWLLFLCGYYIFSKQKTLFVLPMSLFVALLVVLIGPWGMFNVSQNSQTNRLEKLFTQYEFIQDGSVVTPTEEELELVPNLDKSSIVSIIRYLCDTHGCETLQDIYGDGYIEESNNTDNNYFNQTSLLLKKINLDNFYYTGGLGENNQRFLSLYTSYENTSIPVSGFTSMEFINSHVRTGDSDKQKIQTSDGEVVLVYLKDGNIVSKDISKDVREYLLEYGSRSYEETSVNPPALQVGEDLFYITDVSAELKNNALSNISLGGYLLVK